MEYIKRGMVTEEDWEKLTSSQVSLNSENLVLIPYNELMESNKILDIVENSGAEIVVIDDFNGVLLDSADSVEYFLYKLKNIAAQSQIVVFVIYNLSTPKQRIDMRPMLRDFPSDSYYRLFNVVQLLYKPDLFFDDEDDKESMKVIIVKGVLKIPYTIKLLAPDKITGVFALAK